MVRNFHFMHNQESAGHFARLRRGTGEGEDDIPYLTFMPGPGQRKLMDYFR